MADDSPADINVPHTEEGSSLLKYPNLYDHEGKPIVDIPAQDVPAAIHTGRAWISQDAKVPMVDTSGSLHIVDAAAVRNAINTSGYVVAPISKIQDFNLENTYGYDSEQQAKAFAEGALRGVVTDYPATKIEEALGVNPEEIKLRQKYNPDTATLGSIAGIAGSLGAAEIPGVVGTAAKALPANIISGIGGKIAGSVAVPASEGIAAAAGKGVAGAIESGLGATGSKVAQSIAGKAVANVVGSGAGSAIEAALYQTSHQIDESALGDPDALGQQFLHNVGLAAVIGGTFGAGLKGAGEIIPPSITAAKDASLKAYDILGQYFPTQKVAQVVGGISKTAPEDVAQGLQLGTKGAEFREAGFNALGERKKRAKDISGSLSDAYEKVEAASKQYRDTIKSDELKDVINTVTSHDNAFSLAADVSSNINKAVRVIEENPDLYEKAYRASLKDINDGFQKRVLEAKTPYELFQEIENTKRQVQELGTLPKGKQLSDLPLAERKSVILARDTAKPLQLALENEGVWGIAGTRVAKYNEALHEYLGTKEDFDKYFSEKIPSKGKVVSPGKLETYVGQMDKLKGEIKSEVLTNHIASMKKLSDAIGDSYSSSIKNLDLEGLNNVISKISDEANGAQMNVAAANVLNRLKGFGGDTGGVSAVGEGVGVTAGAHMLGLPATPLLVGAAILKGAKSPYLMANTLHAIEQAAKKTYHLIDGSVNAFLKVSEKTNLRRASVVPATIDYINKNKINDSKSDKSKKNKYSKLQSRIEEINNMYNNPSIVADNINKNLPGFTEYAPRTNQSIVQSAMNSIQYLYTKMPKIETSSASISPLNRKVIPSDLEIHRFERTIAAVDNPKSVLKDFEKGIATTDQIDALKATTPAVYGQLLGKVVEKLSTSKQEIPYAKRLQLGILFGVPTDPAMQGQFMALLQSNYTTTVQGEEGTFGPSAAGKTKFSEKEGGFSLAKSRESLSESVAKS